MNRFARYFLFILWAAALASCMELQSETHRRAGLPVDGMNASGGYAEACGDLPGLVGDDC